MAQVDSGGPFSAGASKNAGFVVDKVAVGQFASV